MGYAVVVVWAACVCVFLKKKKKFLNEVERRRNPGVQSPDAVYSRRPG